MRTSVARSKPKSATAKPSVSGKSGRKTAGKSDQRIVSYWIHAGSGDADVKPFTPSALIKELEAGLPVRELEEPRGHLDLPMEKLAPMLCISKATLHWSKAAGRLDVAAYLSFQAEAKRPSMASLLAELDEINREEEDFGEAPQRQDRPQPDIQ